MHQENDDYEDHACRRAAKDFLHVRAKRAQLRASQLLTKPVKTVSSQLRCNIAPQNNVIQIFGKLRSAAKSHRILIEIYHGNRATSKQGTSIALLKSLPKIIFVGKLT